VPSDVGHGLGRIGQVDAAREAAAKYGGQA
jgi:hypothetical protein